MKCERCPIKKNLMRFYDELNGGSCSLCQHCFRWFAMGRRKGGLPVPNAKCLDDPLLDYSEGRKFDATQPLRVRPR